MRTAHDPAGMEWEASPGKGSGRPMEQNDGNVLHKCEASFCHFAVEKSCDQSLELQLTRADCLHSPQVESLCKRSCPLALHLVDGHLDMERKIIPGSLGSFRCIPKSRALPFASMPAFSCTQVLSSISWPSLSHLQAKLQATAIPEAAIHRRACTASALRKGACSCQLGLWMAAIFNKRARRSL